jgi:hypothetical protein
VVELIDEYLKHRAERGTPGARGAAVRMRDVAQLVDRHLQRGCIPSVVPAAADSVLAHLIKLRDEGQSR